MRQLATRQRSRQTEAVRNGQLHDTLETTIAVRLEARGYGKLWVEESMPSPPLLSAAALARLGEEGREHLAVVALAPPVVRQRQPGEPRTGRAKREFVR